jgi:hypothetical protein
MIKNFTFLITTLLLVSQFSFSQIQKAYLHDYGVVSIDNLFTYKSTLLEGFNMDQIVNWPKTFECNASFKNMRGVCLQDLDGDSFQEIIIASNAKIYAYKASGEKLWEKVLIGTAIYPPAAADINNDGQIEIVQVTGGSPDNGRIFVLDHDGNTLPGWPVSFSNHWIICSAALADLNNDKQLEIIAAERANPGKLHVLKNDGTIYSDNWPVSLDGYPGVTPSIAYSYDNRNILPNGGLIDSLIIMCSTKSIFAFDLDGNSKSAFPITNTSTSFSYQSPLICSEKLTGISDAENDFTIIGATHGDLPEFYAFHENGQYVSENWPKPTAGNSWTYAPPIAFGLNETFDFFMFAQPGGDGTNPYPTIHAFSPDGNYIDAFPYERVDGLEGFISAMYSTSGEDLYIFTGSNMKDEDGNGRIHAYVTNPQLSSFTEMEGFPVIVQGFTFMNGVNLGDVNGNGKLDLVALSYDLDFAVTDSIHINIFELNNIDYNPDYCFGTYKGNNLRNGFITPFGLSSKVINNSSNLTDFSVYPNPCISELNVCSDSDFSVVLCDIYGKIIETQSNCKNCCIFKTENLAKGMYFVKLNDGNKTAGFRVIKM